MERSDLTCSSAGKCLGLMGKHKPSSFSECQALTSEGRYPCSHCKSNHGCDDANLTNIELPKENALGEECGNSSP